MLRIGVQKKYHAFPLCSLSLFHDLIIDFFPFFHGTLLLVLEDKKNLCSVVSFDLSDYFLNDLDCSTFPLL